MKLVDRYVTLQRYSILRRYVTLQRYSILRRYVTHKLDPYQRYCTVELFLSGHP